MSESAIRGFTGGKFAARRVRHLRGGRSLFRSLPMYNVIVSPVREAPQYCGDPAFHSVIGQTISHY